MGRLYEQLKCESNFHFVVLFSFSFWSGDRLRPWETSQNHSMVGVGRDLCGSPSPNPC